MNKGMIQIIPFVLLAMITPAFALAGAESPAKDTTAADIRPLTLNELIRIALERNPQLASVRQGIEIAGLGVEELRRRIATDRLSQTRDGLIFNVSSAYYTILKLQTFIEALEKSVASLEESKRVVDARSRAGKAAPTEVLVDVGDPVNKDQIIVTLDRHELLDHSWRACMPLSIWFLSGRPTLL